MPDEEDNSRTGIQIDEAGIQASLKTAEDEYWEKHWAEWDAWFQRLIPEFEKCLWPGVDSEDSGPSEGLPVLSSPSPDDAEGRKGDERTEIPCSKCAGGLLGVHVTVCTCLYGDG